MVVFQKYPMQVLLHAVWKRGRPDQGIERANSHRVEY